MASWLALNTPTSDACSESMYLAKIFLEFANSSSFAWSLQGTTCLANKEIKELSNQLGLEQKKPQRMKPAEKAKYERRYKRQQIRQSVGPKRKQDWCMP